MSLSSIMCRTCSVFIKFFKSGLSFWIFLYWSSRWNDAYLLQLTSVSKYFRTYFVCAISFKIWQGMLFEIAQIESQDGIVRNNIQVYAMKFCTDSTSFVQVKRHISTQRHVTACDKNNSIVFMSKREENSVPQKFFKSFLRCKKKSLQAALLCLRNSVQSEQFASWCNPRSSGDSLSVNGR